MFNAARLKLITGLALLLAALLYWGIFGSPGEILSGDPDDPERVDFFIRDAYITRFDENGQLSRIIESPHLQHFPVPELITLTSPLITLPRDNGGDTQISSDLGSMPDDESKIELAGNVRVIDNSAAETPWVLTTSVMTLLPPDDYAETDAPVQLIQGTNRTDAIGMQAWLREHRIDLLSDVRGYYATY
ncbi:hypothetical protein LH51_02005 [Nitrincola sp. A-D6]|uniref:LPS export ABC transporter periplasmic protein LptC n=1 Tax=Nitrincola sp. A-D6 TaxID=1545442 RepID=UPI00051FD55D|nr:LPS export ABC transporter periplasmic protein LptC [Nitrincola sp. A-D6]KGK43100.1 hypothetical protein LH51_02005 [Nitrincola sp. A-D6]